MNVMVDEYNIDKIVTYLDKYKSNLPILYTWNADIEKLVDLDVLTAEQVAEINTLTPYEKELRIKKMAGKTLGEAKDSNTKLFDTLCLWVIKDWGRIKASDDDKTLALVKEFLNADDPNFTRIASTSKVGSYLYPEKYAIYDSRVTYTLNWILLSENAGTRYFPIPEGRNSRMKAFDMTVLIRLKHISQYRPENITKLAENRQYVSQKDSMLFISKTEAYSEFLKIIKKVHERLWKDDKEKSENLYYTEMLLFSIADTEVFKEIIEHLELIRKK